MVLRSIKHEFWAQQKEAHEAVEENVAACVRSELSKILYNIRRPLAVRDASLKTILPLFKNGKNAGNNHGNH